MPTIVTEPDLVNCQLPTRNTEPCFMGYIMNAVPGTGFMSK